MTDLNKEFETLNTKLNNLNIKVDCLVNEIRSTGRKPCECKRGFLQFKEFVYWKDDIDAIRYHCDACNKNTTKPIERKDIDE